MCTDNNRENDRSDAEPDLQRVELHEQRASVFEHELQPDTVYHDYD